MSTPPLGAGLAPAGTSLAGIGTPATGDDVGGKVYADPATGKQVGARKIDPVTRSYVYDANGRAVGMGGTQQLVQVALSTEAGSSAMRALGQELRAIKRATRTFERHVRDVVASALVHLTTPRLIELVSVTVERAGPSGVRVLVRWRDLSTQQIHPAYVS